MTNDNNLNNFGITKNILFEKEIFLKNYFYRRSVNRIKQVRIYCHSNNCSMATKIFTSPVSLTASVNQILSSEHLLQRQIQLSS